jgi:hypothetical protein
VTNTRRWSGLCVAAAIVFGAGIRLIRIGGESLWFDEGYTAWLVNHPLGQILRLVRADTSPPLYYLLLHVWTQIFGTSEAALRSLSALFGILTIALAADIAKRLSLRPAATAWILALSWWQVSYSQEARSYEMSAFLVTMMLWILVRNLEKPDWRWLVSLIGVGACALYTNNFMPFYIAALEAAGMILPSATPTKRRLRDLAIVSIALFVLYIPWLASLSSQVERVRKDFWIAPPKLLDICQELTRMCGLEHRWTWDQYLHWLLPNTSTEVPIIFAWVLIMGLGVGMIGKQRRTVIALSIAGFTPLLLAVAISLGRRSIFLPAAFIPSSVLIALLISGARRWITIGVVILVGINLIAFEVERTKEDWRGAAAKVASLPPVSHRLVVFVANEGQLPFDYYYRPRPGEIETGAPAGFFDADPPRTQLRVLRDKDLDALREQIVMGNFDDVVLVAAHTEYSDPESRTENYLRTTLHLVNRQDFNNEISISNFKSQISNRAAPNESAALTTPSWPAIAGPPSQRIFLPALR